MECPHCHQTFGDDNGLVYVFDKHGVLIDHGCSVCVHKLHPDLVIPVAA